MNPAILYITIILSLAVIGGFIASKFNQYITVGYILIGLTIGSIITSITAKEQGAKITYVCFADYVNSAISSVANKKVSIPTKKVKKYFAVTTN